MRQALASPVRLGRRSGRHPRQQRKICPGLPSGLGIFPAAPALKLTMGTSSSIGGMTNSVFPRAKSVKPGSPACAAPIVVPRAFGPAYCCAEWRGCVSHYAPYFRAHRVWRAAMFNVLKSFIAEVAGAEAPARSFGEEDYRLAAVALLIHVANVDGETDLTERRRLKTIIEERFGLEAKAVSELITMGEQSDRVAVDFYHFTRVLKRALDDEGRQKIVEMLWEIAFADGVVDEAEENTIWRIAELLGVLTRDRVLLRQRVAGQTPRDVPFEGPWSAPSAKGKA